MSEVNQDRLKQNLVRIQQQVAAAAIRSNRNPADVQLVGVSKYVDAVVCQGLVEAGCLQLGESRPQALWEKAAVLNSKDVQWHMIGHLQRNKIRRTLPLVSWIHAGDSLRLLESIEEEAAKLELRPNVLIEVNISGDSNKRGFNVTELDSVASELARFKHLKIRGLMAMSGLEADAQQTREQFSAMKQLQLRLVSDMPQFDWSQLSMGMSGDFEIAIEEGATLVRVGSALFEGVVS